MNGRNTGASVYQKLRNLAKERGVDMTALLRRYAQERLLYRMSVSVESENFCVKGGLLLSAYNGGDLLRPTDDVDFNGFDPDASVAAVEQAIRKVLATPVADDGVTYDPATIRVEKDRVGRIPGGKISFHAKVHTAKVDVRVDVGFGNPVTPGVRRIVMPTLLDGTAPRPEVLAYPLETVLAEKFHAMVQFGELNTRVKDYFDMWMIFRMHEIEPGTLADAIDRTFEAQGREVPECEIAGLSPAYARAQGQSWKAFLKRIDYRERLELSEVVNDISGNLEPSLVILRVGTAPSP